MSTQPGKMQLHHLPSKISDYIKEHFREGFLIDIHERNDKYGRLIYDVDITQDEISHHLVFTKEGQLMHSDDEPLFPQDPHEDFFPNDEFGRDY